MGNFTKNSFFSGQCKSLPFARVDSVAETHCIWCYDRNLVQSSYFLHLLALHVVGWWPAWSLHLRPAASLTGEGTGIVGGGAVIFANLTHLPKIPNIKCCFRSLQPFLRPYLHAHISCLFFSIHLKTELLFLREPPLRLLNSSAATVCLLVSVIFETPIISGLG